MKTVLEPCLRPDGSDPLSQRNLGRKAVDRGTSVQGPEWTLVQAGHGFLIESFSNPDIIVLCRYCSAELYPRLGHGCEFPQEPAVGFTCECSGCTPEYAIPPGRPRVVCTSKDCYRTLKRDQKRRERRRDKCRFNSQYMRG